MSEYYPDIHRYDDILNLPYHQSTERPRMSLHDRAAQFAPFAALAGHEEAVDETARLTDERVILDESAKEKLDEQMKAVMEGQGEKEVSITYFRPDSKKSGGAYLTDVGTIKKLDEINRQIVMDSGMIIPVENIISIITG